VKKNRPKAYIPPDAEINFNIYSLPPPKTKYDKQMAVFDIEEVKRLVKGKYGKEER